MKKRYRIISLDFNIIIKDGFKSVRAAAAWAEDEISLTAIWLGGWDIVEYYE